MELKSNIALDMEVDHITNNVPMLIYALVSIAWESLPCLVCLVGGGGMGLCEWSI